MLPQQLHIFTFSLQYGTFVASQQLLTHPCLDELGRGADVDGEHVVPDGRATVLAVDEALLLVQPNGLGVHQDNVGEPRHLPEVDVTLL